MEGRTKHKKKSLYSYDVFDVKKRVQFNLLENTMTVAFVREIVVLFT